MNDPNKLSRDYSTSLEAQLVNIIRPALLALDASTYTGKPLNLTDLTDQLVDQIMLLVNERNKI